MSDEPLHESLLGKTAMYRSRLLFDALSRRGMGAKVRRQGVFLSGGDTGDKDAGRVHLQAIRHLHPTHHGTLVTFLHTLVVFE